MAIDKTVVIQIGNSDDKLTQVEWSCFIEEVDAVIKRGSLLPNIGLKIQFSGGSNPPRRRRRRRRCE